MSCFANIKSPSLGTTTTSPAYYQLTTFFPQNVGKSIYEAATTTYFKLELGFDWTKTQYGRSMKTNRIGEPTMQTLNELLDLKLNAQQLRAADQIEEFEAQGYLNVGFNNPQAFELIEAEVNLNPKYQDVETEVIQRDGKYYINVKPIEGIKVQKPVNKNFLKRAGFSPLLIDSVQEFSNASLTELMDSLINSPEVEEFQKEILTKLRRLMKVNPTLKLTVFDDTEVAEEFQRSFYDPKTNTVYIGKTLNSKFGTKEFVRDVIHETIHAYTISAINNPRTPQESLFKMEMIKHYTDYKNSFPILRNYYGLSNVEEFVAEFMSNPYFREQLQEQEKETIQKKSFVANIFTSIRNFFSGIFGVKASERTMKFYQVEQAINNYLNYLETLEDTPDHVSEHHIRFNDTYAQREANQNAQRNPYFDQFYDWIDQNIKSSSWKQLALAMNELDPKLNSVQRLKERFANLSISSTKDVVKDTLGYINSMGNIAQRSLALVEEHISSSKEFEEGQLVKVFNHGLSAAQLMELQLQGFNDTIIKLLNPTELVSKEEYEKDRDAFAEAKEELAKATPGLKNIVQGLQQRIKEVEQIVNNLKQESKRALVSAAAGQMVPYFQLMIDKANAPDSEISRELEEIEREIAILEQQEQSKLVKKFGLKTKLEEFRARKKEILRFKSFVPTKQNLIKLFSEQTESSNTTMIGRFMSIGNMSKIPQVNIIKQFIDVHITESENASLRIREKIAQLNDKISAYNKKKKPLANFGGFGDYFKGFTREVEMHYYDENGNKKVIKQMAYQTKFKEAEFYNDLEDLKAKVDKARAKGDPTEIEIVEAELAKFIEDYAVRPYTDEYYEAEALLIPKAKEKREELLAQINSIEDLFGDEEFEVEGGVASTRTTKRELLREFERLGSIYNIDGTIKPEGSEAREIADSIIAYKQKRKELDILEYVIPENLQKRFEIRKNTLRSNVNMARANALAAQKNFIEAEQAEENADRVAALSKELDQKIQELADAEEKEKAWLEKNTRVEIDPRFFEAQRAIAEQIKEILSKYNQESRLPELYQALFSSVKGFRDQDGVIVGNEIGTPLTKTIQTIEQEMEDIKGVIRKERRLTQQDKIALKELFRKLNDLQTKTNSEYYEITKAEIRSQIKTQVVSDKTLTDQLKERAMQDAIAQLEQDPLSSQKDLNHLNIIKEDLYEAYLEQEVQARFEKSDWYKNNHVDVDVSTYDEDGQLVEEKFVKRPIYIWQQTVPNNPKYIKQGNPSFSWYSPRIRDAFRVRDARFMGELRPRETQDRKYTNEEYEKIAREQPELRELIDEMVGVYEELQRMLPASQRNKGYTVVNKGKDSRETFYDTITGRFRRKFKAFTSLDAFKTYFKANVQTGAGENIEEVERSILEAIEEKGREKTKAGRPRLIKTRYKEPLSSAAVADDLLGALSSFGVYVSEFQGLKKAMPAVFSLRDAFAEKRQEADPEVGMIDDQINRFFYGGENISGVNGFWSKPLARGILRQFKKLFRFSQSRVLLFNIMRVPKNVLTNQIRIVLNAPRYGISRWTALKNIFKGYWNYAALLSLKTNNRKLSKHAMMMAYFRALPTADPTNFASKVHQNSVYKFLNGHTLQAATFGYLEDASTISIYTGIMDQATVPIIINGQTTHIKLEDAYDYIDGVLQPKDGVFGIKMQAYREAVANKANTLEEFLATNGVQTREQLPSNLRIEYDKQAELLDAQIKKIEAGNKKGKQELQNLEQYVRDKIHSMYTSTQGNYFKRSRSKYENHLLLSVLMSMKRWLVPSLNNYYGSRRYSVYTGTLDKGFYNELMAQTTRKLKYLIFKEGSNLGSTEHQRERLRRSGYDTLYSLGLHAITSSMVAYALNAIVQSLGGDDEDDPYWSLILAIIALGTYDEYVSLNPILGPVNFYIKTFEQKPLQKYGADETAIESVVRHTTSILLGQQARSLTDVYDGLDMLSDGKLTSPYYEQYGDKYQIKNNASLFEGRPVWQAAALKISGFEVGAKPFGDPAKRLLTELKFKPMFGIDNPIGEITLIDNRIVEIEEVFKEDVELMIKLNNIRKFTFKKPERGKAVLYPDMNSPEAKEFKEAVMGDKKERGEKLLNFYKEYWALKIRKEVLIESFPTIKEAERRKKISQTIGAQRTATVKKITELPEVFGKGGIDEAMGKGIDKDVERAKAKERLNQQLNLDIMSEKIKVEGGSLKTALKKYIEEAKKDVLSAPDMSILDLQDQDD